MALILSSIDPFLLGLQESCKNLHFKDLIRFLIVRYSQYESKKKIRKKVLNSEGKSFTLLANYYILDQHTGVIVPLYLRLAACRPCL